MTELTKARIKGFLQANLLRAIPAGDVNYISCYRKEDVDKVIKMYEDDIDSWKCFCNKLNNIVYELKTERINVLKRIKELCEDEISKYEKEEDKLTGDKNAESN